jgi:hypothetical protein
MSILEKLASSQGVRDNDPNKELAASLARSKSKKDIQQLVDNLDNKDRRIQGDCIKTLYELGELDPSLIAGHVKAFIRQLDSKNNRMQWGAMTALDAITLEHPKLLFESLPKIIAIADAGSVITTDHCVGILLKLCTFSQYKKDVFDLFIEQLKKCPTNQLPMYAEHAVPVIDSSNKRMFLQVLTGRIDEVEKESKRKRIEKVIKKIK